MQRMLAFVPLDQRPVCVDRVKYAAGAAGFDVQMPDMDDCALYLDGQTPKVPRGINGNGDRILAWLLKMSEAGCRHFIIHLDQMFAGGLAGSRFPDTTEIGEKEESIIAVLVELASRKDHRIYFVDTVMRLASTANYKGYGLAEYHAFREYGMHNRMPMDESAFFTPDELEAEKQIDRIAALYGLDEEGKTLPTGTLTDAQINLYHGFRRRKLLLINRMMQYCAGTYFITADDSCPKPTIMTAEMAFIEKRMQALKRQHVLCSDTDCSGLLALARCVNDLYGVSPRVRVRYFGHQADDFADEFDTGTLRESVNMHLLGAGAAVEDEGDVELLILTRGQQEILQNQEDKEYTRQIRALVAAACENIRRSMPTIIVDASNHEWMISSWRHGFCNLQDELISKVELSRLMAYSNWNTVGNSLGIAVGTGIARYTYLAHGEEGDQSAHRAFVKSITFSCVKDIAYNCRNKEALFPWTFAHWVSHDMGWARFGFYRQMMAHAPGREKCEPWESCDGEHLVNEQLERCMLHNAGREYAHCARRILENLSGGSMAVSLKDGEKTESVPGIRLSRFRCTLYRHFEIGFDIEQE